MKPTEILSEEHKNILKIINALIKECGSLESEKAPDKKIIKEIIDFIQNYADKFHHAKEEDILFKEFEKSIEEEDIHCNPVGQMLYEHDEGRKFVKGMKEGLTENDQNKIIQNAMAYARLLQEHIFKEDNVLYPMINQVLSKISQEQMLRKFKQAENKRFKKGTKNKYISLIEKIGMEA